MSPSDLEAPAPDGAHVTDVRSLRHGFSGRLASAMAFTSIRPLVGFGGGALLVSYAGLASWTALVALLLVLLVVAGVFGALASRWPLEGSVHAWTRQLLGPRWGVVAGWLYLWSYLLFLSSLAYFDTQRIFFLLGTTPPSHFAADVVSALLVLTATAMNVLSRRWLTRLLVVAVASSVVGCLAFSLALIVGHAQRPISALDDLGATSTESWLAGPFLVALAWAAAFAFRGFELPSDVAEEIDEPRRAVPRAMLWALLVGGLLTILSAVAISLSALAGPGISADLANNPYAASVGSTVEAALGAGAAKLLALLAVIATFAALSVAQLATSRTVWTMARDREVPGHRRLVRLTATSRTPRNALVAVAIVAAILPFLIGNQVAYILQGASVAPLMFAFLLPVVGLLIAMARRTWQPGQFGLGRATVPAAVLAAAALVGLGINSTWPRAQLYGSGSSQWTPTIILVALVVSALALMAWAFRDGGIHVRNHGHVDRDLHERILLAHTGTCSLCHRTLAKGEEALWNPEAHVTLCIACDTTE